MCQVEYMTLLFSHMCVCEFHFVSSFFQKFSHDLSVSHCVSSFGNSIFFVLLNIALVPILKFAWKLIVNQAYMTHVRRFWRTSQSLHLAKHKFFKIYFHNVMTAPTQKNVSWNWQQRKCQTSMWNLSGENLTHSILSIWYYPSLYVLNEQSVILGWWLFLFSY